MYSPTWRRRRLLRLVLAVLVAITLAMVAAAAVGAFGAARAARQGRDALVRAEGDLAAGRLAEARQDLEQARAAFARMAEKGSDLGPLLPLARVTPLVRVQLRGAEAFAEAGLILSGAGMRLADAAAGILDPADTTTPVSAAVEQLRAVDASLGSGVASIDDATARVAKLNGYRLVGPLGDAHRDLARRLPGLRARAASAKEGTAALIAFAGGSAPRRYLVFSQNPDEVRPTGGFIGSYGVLRADGGRLSLDRYASIESWYLPRPQAVVPPEEAPTAFGFNDPPLRQTIANVNSTPDWPQAARLAAGLWRRGGEEPVDGVVSLTPDFLARILEVLGPVAVPPYDETVTAANLVERVDHHTHREQQQSGDPSERKRFLVSLASAVVQRLLDAPASSWYPLARSMSLALDRREAMAWVANPGVNRALAAREWDGAVPSTDGDFFFGAEFEYQAKNGRSLKRTYDHSVAIGADGSARVETVVTIANTAPFNPSGLLNVDSSSYISVYGPEGAMLDAASDRPDAEEAAIAGHPAAGWLRSAPPLGSTTLKVVWRVPRLVQRRGDGPLEYRLRWMRVAGHEGDVVNLRVSLPPGWRWEGRPPPARIDLTDDVDARWAISSARR